MDKLTVWLTLALIVVGAASAVGALGQLLNQRRQRRLAEAEAHVQQANAWASLNEDWRRCMVVVAGESAIWIHGLSPIEIAELRDAVERYRLARVAWNDVLGVCESSDDDAWQKAADDEAQARERLAPHAQSVQRVVTHLGQLSSLILRKQLSVEAVYGSLGPVCLRMGDDLIKLVKMGYAHNDGCVAPDNAERRLWAALTPSEVIGRLGWGNFLDVARGTAERVVMLLELMKLYALRVGDLTEGPSVEYEHPGVGLCEVDRLAIVWRAARPFGRIQAARLILRLAAAGRAVRRRYSYWNYPAWVTRMWRRFRDNPFDPMPSPNWITWLPDKARLPFDLARTIRRARSIKDIRLLDPPHVVEDNMAETSQELVYLR